LRNLRRSVGEVAIDDNWKMNLKKKFLTLELTMEQIQQAILCREIQKCRAESLRSIAELTEANLLVYGAIEVVETEQLTNALKKLCEILSS
jgi:hypothetical protein